MPCGNGRHYPRACAGVTNPTALLHQKRWLWLCVCAALLGWAASARAITVADADEQTRDHQSCDLAAVGGAQADADASVGGSLFVASAAVGAAGQHSERNNAKANDEPAWKQQLRDWVRYQVVLQQPGEAAARQTAERNQERIDAASVGQTPLRQGADAQRVAFDAADMPGLFQLNFNAKTGGLQGFTIAAASKANASTHQTAAQIGQALTTAPNAGQQAAAPKLSDFMPAPSRGESASAGEADPQDDSFLANTYRLGMKRSTQIIAVCFVLVGYLGLTWWLRRRLDRLPEVPATRRHGRNSRHARHRRSLSRPA